MIPRWLHDIYLLSCIFFFFLDSKYERGDNKKYLSCSNDRVHGNIGFFKWLVMKVGKKESSYR